MGCCPVLDSFHCVCCSCSLRSATLALGWMEMILGLVQTVWYSVYFVKFEEFGRVFWFDSEDLNIILLSEGAVFCLCCLLLLYGTYKISPWFMVPYLVLSLLWIFVITTILIIVSFSKLFRKFYIGLLILMTGFSIIMVMLYLWIVQYSYCRVLIQQKSIDIKTKKTSNP